MKHKQTIIQTIQAKIPDAEVFIEDPREDNRHLEGVVISDMFEGMPLVKQHQVVMEALQHLFASSLHAFSLKTYTKSAWKTKQGD